MENFMIATGVVAPLVVYMVIGALIRNTGMFSKENFKALNVVIFKVFIPLAMFFDIKNTDLSDVLTPALVGYVVGFVVLVFLIASVIIPKFVPDRADASTLIQAMFRSNFVLFGVTIGRILCGEEGVGQVAAFAAIVPPVFNMLAVIMFETRRGEKVKPGKLILNIFKNPLVQAGILGLLFNFLNIPIPKVISDPLQKLAGSATPIALLTLGGILSMGSIRRHVKVILTTSVVRLIGVPLAALTGAILMGYRGDVIVMILAVFGSPVAVASVPMAQTMGGNGELGGELVAATTVFSILTIFLFVFALSTMGIIG